MNRSWFSSLSQKISYIIFSLLFLSIIIVLVIDYKLTSAELESSLGKELLGIAKTTTLAIQPSKIKIVESSQNPASQEFLQLRSTLRKVKAENNLSTEIYILTPSGSPDFAKFTVMTNNKPFIGHKYKMTPLLQKAFQENIPVITPRYQDDYGEWISAFVPIKGEDKSVVGVLQLDYSIVTLNDALKSRFMMLSIYGIGILLLAMLVSAFLSRSITNPLTEMQRQAKKFAEGDNDVEFKVKSNDEIADLANVLSTLVESNRNLAEMATLIGSGNFDKQIEIRSSKDSLGSALVQLQKNLTTSSKKLLKQNWLNEGQAELNNKLRGNPEIATLAKNVLDFLTRYLGCPIGAIYIRDEEHLKMINSFSFNFDKENPPIFQFGEGLVGQSAADKKTLSISNVPYNFLKINTGIGEGSPLNIIVVPFLHEDELLGIIELASFEEITEVKKQFLDLVVENIGISFYSAKSRDQMAELLGKTQQQAHKLQSQQEVLRVTNDELEEQARILKESEERLQSNQEELREINLALEEKTRALEKQKENIKIKNQELKFAQAELEEKAKALEMSSKYKSEFLANMSHELRTPLNSILILSKLLSNNKKGNLTIKQMEFAKTIYSAGNDLLNLINEVLDLSKVEAGKIEIHVENVKLVEFSDYIKTNFKHVVEDKGINFAIEIDEELNQELYTDRQRVEQIIKNFISNAMKFTPVGGQITFKIHKPYKNFESRILNLEETIGFSVIDTGKGIAKEKQKMIFDAFQQEDGSTSRKYGGTGLGLSISKEFAKLLQGEINLVSEIGSGSTFTLYIPEILKVEDNESLPENKIEIKTKNAPNSIGEKISKINIAPPKTIEAIIDDRKVISEKDKVVLIIETDPVTTKILSDKAHNKGMKVLLADNGNTCLQMADFYKPSAIILLQDLPEINGKSVLFRLKENNKTRHIPVFMLSNKISNFEAIKSGAIGCITKPVDSVGINEIFDKVLEFFNKENKSLLIASKSKESQNRIAELVQGDDLRIATVANSVDFVKIINVENFDCIILDNHLEDMSGIDFLGFLKQSVERLEVPIIFNSQADLDEEEIRIYENNFPVKVTITSEQLLNISSLLLHRKEENLSEAKRKIVNKLNEETNVIKGKHILLVDDDMRNILATSSILQEHDLRVTTAHDGKECLKALSLNPDEIDLILMDIMMPNMNGFEAMHEIRNIEKFKNLPIIALTAKAMQGDRKKCLNAGANDYLSKPLDEDKLLAQLRVWLYQ
ncbi:MAG: response regulator [Calditrichaeota bacterium]|nr:MAG: response regulator [Calditrichota bacterium]